MAFAKWTAGRPSLPTHLFKHNTPQGCGVFHYFHSIIVTQPNIGQVTFSDAAYFAGLMHNSYPFGMLMLDRHDDSESYRYGFNGMEKDDEVSGEGNSYDFGARMYDPRLGRFMSVDPYAKLIHFQSPYVFADNNPINLIDFQGKYGKAPQILRNVGKIKLELLDAKRQIHFYEERLGMLERVLSSYDRSSEEYEEAQKVLQSSGVILKRNLIMKLIYPAFGSYLHEIGDDLEYDQQSYQDKFEAALVKRHKLEMRANMLEFELSVTEEINRFVNQNSIDIQEKAVYWQVSSNNSGEINVYTNLDRRKLEHLTDPIDDPLMKEERESNTDNSPKEIISPDFTVNPKK